MKWKKREKKWIGSLALITYLSGLSLFVFSHFLRISGAVGEQHHPWEHGVRFIHSTLTYGLLVAFGYMGKAHVLPSWQNKKRQRRISGGFVVGTVVLLWISALGVLYLGDEAGNLAIAWVHGVLGLLFPLLLFPHILSRATVKRS